MANTSERSKTRAKELEDLLAEAKGWKERVEACEKRAGLAWTASQTAENRAQQAQQMLEARFTVLRNALCSSEAPLITDTPRILDRLDLIEQDITAVADLTRRADGAQSVMEVHHFDLNTHETHLEDIDRYISRSPWRRFVEWFRGVRFEA